MSSDSTRPYWTNGTLTVSSIGPTSLTLTWSGASDDTAVSTYKVYRGSSEIAEISSPTVTYDATGLRAGETYTFSVEAVDAAGNKSIDGPTAKATTPTAEYGKVEIAGVYSKNSDYSNPKVAMTPNPFTTQPTKYMKVTVEAEMSVGTEVQTSQFSGISFVMIKNLGHSIDAPTDVTGIIEVAIGTADNPKSSVGAWQGNSYRIAPKGIFITTDMEPSKGLNVLSDPDGEGTPVVLCEVFIAGY